MWSDRSDGIDAHGWKRLLTVVTVATIHAVATAGAQVAIHPPTTQPAAWERFAVRVANNGDTSVTTVRVEVPDVVLILGVEPVAGWTAQVARPEAAAQTVTWAGGALRRGEFREFALLGRVAGDAREKDVVFPVYLTLADGSTAEWARGGTAGGVAPRVRIVGRAQVSARGAVALAGAAIGISIMALALAVARRTKATGGGNP